MDSLIAAAGRALATGDALGALKRVALRDDPPALALRGIAMAQLGDYPRARELLRRAGRGFGVREELACARCVVAEAEVALAMRDLRGSPRALASAAAALDARSDRANAVLAHVIAARRLLLLGRVDEAAASLAGLDLDGLPSALTAMAELAAAELALRSLRTAVARAALGRAVEAAERARVPALLAEAAEARAALDRPAARRAHAGHVRPLRLDEVEALFASGVIAEARIDKVDPATGDVVASIPAPGHGGDSGLAWAERSLWVGQYRERRIYQVNPDTGVIVRTIESNRFVTGVTWVDGELWHGTWEGDESELRHIDPDSGAVLERLAMPPGTGVSGLESDGADLLYCGGGASGTLRAVRRPKGGE